MASVRGRKVKLEGRGDITLGQQNYITTGGEGSLWRAHGTVIKIYTDTKKMVRDSMAAKIKLLSGFKHPFVVRPRGLVSSSAGKAIGYYMSFVKGEPLSRVFTNDFRAREGFGDKDAVALTERMMEVVSFAHGRSALLIDANEFNWLVRLGQKKGPEPHLLDVDSWALGRWGPKVVMPSIHDWHSKDFNELTDWFSWGVVTFQVFTGIHPYKGKLKGSGHTRLEERMKANVSVFDPNVSLNRAVRDFSSIPGPLRDWYYATFQEGARSAPPHPALTGPSVAAAALTMRVSTLSGGGLLVFERILASARDKVLRVWPCGVALRHSGLLVDLSSGRDIGHLTSPKGEVVKTKGGWLVVDRKGKGVELTFISETSLDAHTLDLNLRAKDILRYENRLFAITSTGLVELRLSEMKKPILSTGKTWQVMGNSTRWFDGVGIQDAMGSTFLVTPFGERSLTSVRVPELDGLVPQAALAGERFVAVIAVDKKGDYHKFEIAFNKTYSSYKVWRGKADSSELNVVALPRGVCATIVQDGELSVFVPSSGELKKVRDKGITTDMKLFWWADQVLYIKRGGLGSVRMK